MTCSSVGRTVENQSAAVVSPAAGFVCSAESLLSAALARVLLDSFAGAAVSADARCNSKPLVANAATAVGPREFADFEDADESLEQDGEEFAAALLAVRERSPIVQANDTCGCGS